MSHFFEGGAASSQAEDTTTVVLLAKLQILRTELIDLAYRLECQGRADAADLATSTSLRIAAICEQNLTCCDD
jgi:hypothetical protein